MATTPNPSFDISTDQGFAQRNEGLNIGLVLESSRVTRERAKGLLADAIKSFDAKGNPPRGFQTTVEDVIMVVEQALNGEKTGTSEEDPNSIQFRKTYGTMGSTAKATKKLLEQASALLSGGGARRKRRSKTYRKRKLLRKRTSRRN
jgi:hypothetical protein